MLLLYLTHVADPHRCAVGPALAAMAERAGWSFDLHHHRGRDGVRPGRLHLDHALDLTRRHAVAAAGDPDSPLWPVIEAQGEVIVRTTDPATLFAAVLARLRQPAPEQAVILDSGPQTPLGLVAAPFLYPGILSGHCLSVDVTATADLRARLEALGVRRFIGLFVDPQRARAFPGGLDALDGRVAGESYATLTAGLARRFASWGDGTLLGPPDLIAAQLPIAARRRLLPLHGRPQTDVIERAADVIRAGADPVYGRPFDEQDVFALGRIGRGLHMVDAEPPVAAPAVLPPHPPEPLTVMDPAACEPDDATVRR